ncbi:hypothetical protein [Winogradskyella sp. PE311]|uniref:hypothetical protein n=1 Tax=Winogradskyella sp. PE311 TaxID=3366943 RepID=UPI00397EE2B5
MTKNIQHNLAIFFTILFMTVISAPSIIMSMDDSIDISYVFGENEEEEKETFKLLFEINVQDFDNYFSSIRSTDCHSYTYKNYQKPHLNLISPPPEKALV